VISMNYGPLVDKKPAPLEKVANTPEKHIIHKAIEWKRMLDEGIVTLLNEIAKREGLSRARVTQVMNLLRLPVEVREFLSRLDDLKEIRRHTERRVRNNLNILPPNDSWGIQ
jgi:ParB-like chromosome segregation protein Spo0J